MCARWLLLLLVILATAAYPIRLQAQAVGDCAPGSAEAELDINDVLARVFNGGNLFYGNATTNGDGYLVPKGSLNSPIYNTELWIGGTVDGEVRASGTQYSRFEFWPGPLGEDGAPPTAEQCAANDRIYVVSRGDIARYYATGEATDDLRDWPFALGAPVLDGDGVVGNYDLAGGDQPAVWGEQTAWWVMNDAGNDHASTGTFYHHTPLPIEVQVAAFAVPWPRPELDQATFYHYRIRYEGEMLLDSVYVGLWSDVDLGSASDDHIGTDTTLDMSFVYNASEVDANYEIPPAAGFRLLQGPVGLPNGRDDDHDGAVDEVGERLGVTASSCYFDSPFFGPSWDAAVYNCLRGLWLDGSPIIAYSLGYRPNQPADTTTFAYPADPVLGAYWSEENRDSEGTSGVGGDRFHSLMSGPFRLVPGEEISVTYAIVFAQGEDRLDSVTELRRAAVYVENAYNLGLLHPSRVAGAPGEPEPPSAFALSRPYPNPFRSSAALTLTVPEGAQSLRLAVYDVLGREVTVLAEGVLAPGDYPLTLDGTGLAAGAYVVRFETGLQTESIRVTKLD